LTSSAQVAGLLEHEIIAPLIYDCNTNTEVFNSSITPSLHNCFGQCSISQIRKNGGYYQEQWTLTYFGKLSTSLCFFTTLLVLSLSKHSPDLNPIEKYWALITCAEPVEASRTLRLVGL